MQNMAESCATPPLTSAKATPLQAYDSPPSSHIINRNASDEEFEFIRRAPQKGERPVDLQKLHEGAALACAKILFAPDDDSSTCSTFSLTIDKSGKDSCCKELPKTKTKQAKQQYTSISQMAS